MNRIVLPGVLAGVLLAGAASAAQPVDAGQAQAASGLKVGIDAATGRLRPLTEEEAALLDATVVAQPRTAKSLAAVRAALPATVEEAEASAIRLPNGMVAMKLPATHLNSLVVERDAQGNLVISHEGDDVHAQPGAREVASE